MKKILIPLLLLTACKKEPRPITIGMKFNYIWQQYGNRPWVGKEPAQPFTVDSLDSRGYGNYWVSNGEMSFTVYPDVIEAGRLK